jgi:hypothetical protein
MFTTVPLAVVGKGFVRLNVILLPVSLLLLAYLGIMAGGAPNSAGRLNDLWPVAAFVFLTPAALVLIHVVGAKIVDAVLRIVPPASPDLSWFGIVAAAALVVVAGNVFIDDLHQFRNGHYGLSVAAFCLDVGGMAAVVAAGGGRVPPLRP